MSGGGGLAGGGGGVESVVDAGGFRARGERDARFVRVAIGEGGRDEREFDRDLEEGVRGGVVVRGFVVAVFEIRHSPAVAPARFSLDRRGGIGGSALFAVAAQTRGALEQRLGAARDHGGHLGERLFRRVLLGHAPDAREERLPAAFAPGAAERGGRRRRRRGRGRAGAGRERAPARRRETPSGGGELDGRERARRGVVGGVVPPGRRRGGARRGDGARDGARPSAGEAEAGSRDRRREARDAGAGARKRRRRRRHVAGAPSARGGCARRGTLDGND